MWRRFGWLGCVSSGWIAGFGGETLFWRRTLRGRGLPLQLFLPPGPFYFRRSPLFFGFFLWWWLR